jgi:fatty-acyl-CoA synthase
MQGNELTLRNLLGAAVRTTRDLEREPLTTWVHATNFRELLEAPSIESPDDVAFQYRQRGFVGSPTTNLTFQEAIGLERQAANALASFGMRTNDVVAVMLPLVDGSHCVLYGAMAQTVAMPLNYMLEATHLIGLLNAAEAKAIVVASDYPDDPGFALKLKRIRAERSDLLVFEFCRRNGALQETSSQETSQQTTSQQTTSRQTTSKPTIDFRKSILEQPNAVWICSDTRSPDDPVALCHTGGTTGLPKLVKQTFRMYQCSTLNHRVTVGYGRGERILTGLPLFHASGALDAGLFAHVNETTISVGSELGLQDGDFVTNYWEIAALESTTIGLAIPTTVAQWASQPGAVDVPSMTHLATGGAPLPTEVARQMVERMNGRPIIEVWGMTETAGIYTSLPLDGEQRIGSVGFTAPYCQLAVIPAGEDSTLAFQPPGELGEIVIRGPQVTPGYVAKHHNESAWAGEGWLRTGDLGHIDDDGYIWITGRSKDLIIRESHNIGSKEVRTHTIRDSNNFGSQEPRTHSIKPRNTSMKKLENK